MLNIGSIAGLQPLPGAAAYSATKAFVQTFSEAVHEGLHATGVSCTVLCPGPVPTEWWEVAGERPPGSKSEEPANRDGKLTRKIADGSVRNACDLPAQKYLNLNSARSRTRHGYRMYLGAPLHPQVCGS